MLLAVCLALPGGVGHAMASGYGGGSDRVAVCRATSSQFRPYVKVTVPAFVADRFLDQGGVLPDEDGNCPEGIDIREYVQAQRQKIYERIADIFGNVFGRFTLN